MGLSSRLFVYARHRHGPGGRYDRGQAQRKLWRQGWPLGCHGLILALLLGAIPASADTFRIAIFVTDLDRRGPGLLLRDLMEREEDDIRATLRLLAHVDPDILLLANVDVDLRGATAKALQAALAAEGLELPYAFAPLPNSGQATGLDMDANGRLGEARDAMGYGAYTGAHGMILLSAFPLDTGAAQNFSEVLWRDLPWATMPVTETGAPFPSAEVHAVWRLSTTGHWTLPVQLPGGQITLMASYGTPPVFDGPEDANGLRNAAETLFWVHHLDGAVGTAPPGAFVLLSAANLDPFDGDGRSAAMAQLLSHPRVQDPRPSSPGGQAAADQDHRGDPALDTVDWPDGRPGNLRVDYVLPSAELTVVDSGVFWPPPDNPLAELLTDTGPHRVVWVDIALP